MMGAIDLETESIASLGARMVSGELTAHSLTEHCLARIEEFDPKVNAIIEINPDALDIADQRDGERRDGRVRGPLHGLPILVKDNLDTADRMMTTAGSLALAGSIATEDAFVVTRLRDAGAVLLAKTNLSEWANFRSTRSSSGWSSRGGQTRNPYALDRTPGGSSSGSAVAVAAGFCVGAIGTETDGSIVSPSAMNSIVGIKPTVGLVSRAGIVPISHSQDTAGPMARSVGDAAILLRVIAGEDPADNVTKGASGRLPVDFGTNLDADALNGARIGVARNYCGFHQGVDRVLARSLEVMADAGAEVIDDLELTPKAEIEDSETIVMMTEFKAGLNRYLSERAPKARIRSLADAIAFNQRCQETVMPYFRQERFEQSAEMGALTDAAYLKALETSRRLARDEGIDRLLGEHDLDAIVAPTTCPPWLIDWVNGDNRSGGSACTAAVAGYPSITVPGGYVFGLPVGVSFFSTAFKETELIQLAHTFENATKVRRPPTFASRANY